MDPDQRRMLNRSQARKRGWAAEIQVKRQEFYLISLNWN